MDSGRFIEDLVNLLYDLHSKKELGGIEFFSIEMKEKFEVIIKIRHSPYKFNPEESSVNLINKHVFRYNFYKITFELNNSSILCNLKDLDEIRFRINVVINSMTLISTFMNIYLIESNNNQKIIKIYSNKNLVSSILIIKGWKVYINSKNENIQ